MTLISEKLYCDGNWVAGAGADLVSLNPADGSVVWQGREASSQQVDDAFAAARRAFGPWRRIGVDGRIEVLRRFAKTVQDRSDELTTLISRETGKPKWESKTEVATVVGKIELSIDALRSRRDTVAFDMAGVQAVTRFKPHGVLAVLGPYNFPAHLPNGHIVPALLAGNTIVFKPSELTPFVGAWMTAVWHDADLPAGVLNLVHGGRSVGQSIVAHEQLDGILFTGSSHAGMAIHQSFAKTPHKVLALEMGGNNPLVVYQVSDLDAAAYLVFLSAFFTAGQRCTCARRLIVVEDGNTDDFLRLLSERIHSIRVGYYTDVPEPFCGTVITREAGMAVQAAYSQLVDAGARVIAPVAALRGNPALLSPGIVEWTGNQTPSDSEVFGPLLTVFRAATFEQAIAMANETAYGLSAGLLSDSREAYEQFIDEIRAGIVNWNRQTTGASGKLPFGGCGLSGNHRPAGYYSADYCSYPVASLEFNKLVKPEKTEIGLDWI